MTVPEDGTGSRWRKAKASGQGQDCVEVDMDDPSVPSVGVRDSKDPDGGEIRLQRASFGALRAVLKSGGGK